MGRIGEGHGSEFHLKAYLAEHVEALDRAVRTAIGSPEARCEWLRSESRRELRGMEFLDARAIEVWKQYWPQTGQPQNWDAVGRLVTPSTTEWLLVEAKARSGEFLDSPPCQAKGRGREIIEAALLATRRHLVVPDDAEWTGAFYQVANRLAAWHFLQNVVKQPAHMLFLHFTGDVFPDGSTCPGSEAEWRPLLMRAWAHLQLPDHPPRIHHVFLPAVRDAGVS